MSVYVDQPRYPYRNMLMCHMVADSLEELHSMAAKLGLRPQWFQERGSTPHYDICKAKRAKAVSLGAVEVSGREMVKHCQRIRRRLNG